MAMLRGGDASLLWLFDESVLRRWCRYYYPLEQAKLGGRLNARLPGL